MHTPGWSLATLLLTAPALFAQAPQARPGAQPAAPPGQPAAAAPPADPRLDTLLLQWEQRMKAIQALDAKVERHETDPLTNAVTVFHGTARFLRDGYRADLYLVKKTNPQVYERFLCTGPYLYEFRPKDKLVRAHALPQRAPGQPPVDDNFLGFLFGMEAREAKRRYDLRLVDPKVPDPHYYYLLVRPRFPADQAEFTEARVVLFQKTLLPAQMIFVPTNGTEVKWNILSLDPAAPLGPQHFQKPKLPDDWKLIDVPPPNQGLQPRPGAIPTAAPPTKVRPSGG
jgi:TIGR03009 family protein